MTDDIAVEDRITYGEAVEITQRSPGYLLKLVNAGRLSRVGGQRGAAHRTFLSRNQVEELALEEYRRGRTGRYWMTLTQVAALTGMARASIHQARESGRLIAHRTQLGDWLVRSNDAERFNLDRQRSLLVHKRRPATVTQHATSSYPAHVSTWAKNATVYEKAAAAVPCALCDTPILIGEPIVRVPGLYSPGYAHEACVLR